MYKVVDGQICLLSVVDKKAIDTRVQNAVVKIANIDNQLRTLLEQKQRVLTNWQISKKYCLCFTAKRQKR